MTEPILLQVGFIFRNSKYVIGEIISHVIRIEAIDSLRRVFMQK